MMRKVTLLLIAYATSTPILANTSLNKIVTPKLLGTNLRYAEHLIGSPPMRDGVDGVGVKRYFYNLNGCSVFIGSKDDKVVSVGAYISEKNDCDIDVSEIVNKQNTMASTTILSDYAHRGDLHFTNTNIPSCNACREGEFNAIIDGVGALNYTDIRLISKETNQWDKFNQYLYSSGMDGDARMALPMDGNSCPLRKYDGIGYKLLSNSKVIGIEFGRFGSLQPQCNGEAVHELNLRHDYL